jgi:hypothetical protein
VRRVSQRGSVQRGGDGLGQAATHAFGVVTVAFALVALAAWATGYRATHYPTAYPTAGHGSGDLAPAELSPAEPGGAAGTRSRG